MLRYLRRLFRGESRVVDDVIKRTACPRCQKPLSDGSRYCIACGFSGQADVIEMQANIELELQRRKERAEKARTSPDVDVDVDDFD